MVKKYKRPLRNQIKSEEDVDDE